MNQEEFACFPLCKRGSEGDFCICEMLKSPLAPFFKGGNVAALQRGSSGKMEVFK
jgi:hypothetical protein